MRAYRPRRGKMLGHPYADMAEITLLTGLRLGELLALRGADVDLERGMLRVAGTMHADGTIGAPKTGTSHRPVALSPRALELLRPLVRRGLIFRTTGESCRHCLDRALVALDLKQRGRSWHELRHAHSALLDESGVGIRAAGARMGHGPHFAQTAAYGWAAERVHVDALDAVWLAHVKPPVAA